MTDDRWRDTYDEWKLACPYDDDPEDQCDHEEYEVDWEGCARCDRCGERWWLTADQLTAHHEAEARRMEEYDRAMRREQSRFWRAVDWLRLIQKRSRLTLRRKPKPPLIDDDIPF